jgi:NTE family protein
MLGMALEGGGAKGAFHMGVMKAFLEEGYEFGGITGTSIGALNGAVIAQGDFEKGYQMWESIDTSLLFDLEQEQLTKIINRQIDKNTVFHFAAKVKEFIKNRGIDKSKIRQLVESVIVEDKLRKSPMDFGLVTVSVSELKPLELYKEDIPQGKMIEYLMASSSFPGFQMETIDGKHYLDGGLYDNCPVNLLARKGYKEIIVVRTLSIGVIQDIKYPNVKVTSIKPFEDLGNILNFDHELIKRNLKMGYDDAMHTIKKLKGKV